MQIFVNGTARDLAEGCTLAELVAALGLEAAPLAVERNGALVRRAAFSTTRIENGDRLELVTLVWGG